jgi:hypothetical protein
MTNPCSFRFNHRYYGRLIYINVIKHNDILCMREHFTFSFFFNFDIHINIIFKKKAKNIYLLYRHYFLSAMVLKTLPNTIKKKFTSFSTFDF